jgi:deoxyribonuclease V
MDLGTAEELVLRVSPRYRIPEPIRRADRKVGEMRREAC